MFRPLSFRLVPLWQEEGDGSFITETLGIGEGELDAHGADGGGIWGGVLGREQLKQVPGPVSRKQEEKFRSVPLSVSLPSLNIYIFISSPHLLASCMLSAPVLAGGGWYCHILVDMACPVSCGRCMWTGLRRWYCKKEISVHS